MEPTMNDGSIQIEVDKNGAVESNENAVKKPCSPFGAFKEIYRLIWGNRKLMGGTIITTIAASIFSIVMLICAITAREKTMKGTNIPSGVLMGSIGTIIMSILVIHSYLFLPTCRNHSNILLLNRCICDLMLALSFVLEPVWNLVGGGIQPDMSCQWLATIREYFIMTSVCWEFCMAIDLFLLLNDPFTSPQNNRRKYQIACHILGLIAGAIMLGDMRFHGVSVGDFCWVKCSSIQTHNFDVLDPGIWIFVIAPVIIFVFRGGIEATLDHRRTLLREGFLTTIALIVYWVLLWGIYVAFWLTKGNTVLSELFGFVFSFRGSVVFFLWILYSTSEKNLKQSAAERENATRAQTNYALLKELVFYTTRGITKAVQVANKRQNLEIGDTSIFTVHPPQNQHAQFSCQECKFTDYRSDAFGRLREFFGIDERAFIQSFSDCSIPKVSEGSSGSFMFFTTNGLYIVKSLTRRESAFLNSIVDAYSAYVMANPNTFLTRILGSYSMVLYGRESCFAVMENLFDKQHAVHHRYDIKGSWVDRNAEKARNGAECTCRYCNMTFRSGSRDACPNRAGFHSPNVVLKDMDLTAKVRLGAGNGAGNGEIVLKQLKKDSSFLCEQGIMDYSLLLGVIEVRFQVNMKSIVRDDSDRDHFPSIDALNAISSVNPSQISMEKQSILCLRSADVVVGPGFYYIGIIDILQTWTWQKRFERWVKTLFFRKDSDGISAIPPKPYCERFQKKMDEIIHVNGYDCPSPHIETHSASQSSKIYPAEDEIKPTFSFRNEIWQNSPQTNASIRPIDEEDVDASLERTDM
ncbi:phosphatidylinositol-4-phosphate-5-kinase (PIPK-D6/GPCR-PIPK) [Thraustotheca clavata]|uniref:Phosphatidylinositol-4-phosphate-5-kinase (PIPK-D6/GPCR-PIPK) n=1 Tax=Thraustotheca clavata TaxID=74557 RepID=A0A1W0A0K9_9STRA|nr:phosphatidylinositol-4-phosphate-5-kinase (PIPK-D6/GPCR-PIPK) [Thraustotheca clavata]